MIRRALYQPSLFSLKSHFDSIKRLFDVILLLLGFCHTRLFIKSLNSFLIDLHHTLGSSGYSLFCASWNVFGLPYAYYITTKYEFSLCIKDFSSDVSSNIITLKFSFM